VSPHYLYMVIRRQSSIVPSTMPADNKLSLACQTVGSSQASYSLPESPLSPAVQCQGTSDSMLRSSSDSQPVSQGMRIGLWLCHIDR
jgi:hypothetical protein